MRALDAVEGKKPKKTTSGFWGMGGGSGGDSKAQTMPQLLPQPPPKLAPIPEKKMAEVPKKVIAPELEEKIKRVNARCAAKAKIALSADRLLEDKLYLTVLANSFEEHVSALLLKSSQPFPEFFFHLAMFRR